MFKNQHSKWQIWIFPIELLTLAYVLLFRYKKLNDSKLFDKHLRTSIDTNQTDNLLNRPNSKPVGLDGDDFVEYKEGGEVDEDAAEVRNSQFSSIRTEGGHDSVAAKGSVQEAIRLLRLVSKPEPIYLRHIYAA